MQELLDVLSYGDEDGVDLTLTSVHLRGDELSLDLDAVDASRRRRRWCVIVGEVEEHRIQLGRCGSMRFEAEHPLVWSSSEPQAGLYFSDAPRDVLGTVGALWRRHRQETRGWIPFERFLNGHLAVDRLLGTGAGLLAHGPQRLLEAYGLELDAQAVPWNIVGGRPLTCPYPAPGAAPDEEDRSLRVLTFDASYVIGAGFWASERR